MGLARFQVTRPLTYRDIRKASTATSSEVGILFGTSPGAPPLDAASIPTRTSIATKGAATMVVAKDAIGRPAHPSYLMLYRR